jgi:hypothetical protein
MSCPSGTCTCVPDNRIHDPLYVDLLARSNRITNSLTQHVSTLDLYTKQFSDLDARQKTLLGDIIQANENLQQTGHSSLDEAIPEIRQQNRTMGKIESRVERARDKLVEQRDMVYFRETLLMIVGGN